MLGGFMCDYGEDCELCRNKIACALSGTTNIYTLAFKKEKFWAIDKLSKGLCKFILNHKNIIDFKPKYDTTFLHQCAKHYIDALKHPYLTIVCKSNGWTPLHDAAMHFEQSIYNNKADKLQTKDKGVTPLHMAARIFPVALDHKSCHIVQDLSGFTPLHYYAFEKNTIPELEIVLKKPESNKSKNFKTAQQLAYAKIKKIERGELTNED
jgi:ankyrin repeat protein